MIFQAGVVELRFSFEVLAFKSPFGWLAEAKVNVSHVNMPQFIKYIVIWVYHVECTYLSYFGVYIKEYIWHLSSYPLESKPGMKWSFLGRNQPTNLCKPSAAEHAYSGCSSRVIVQVKLLYHTMIRALAQSILFVVACDQTGLMSTITAFLGG